MCFDACELLKIQLLFFIQPQSIYAIHYSHTFIFTAITANITAITAKHHNRQLSDANLQKNHGRHIASVVFIAKNFT